MQDNQYNSFRILENLVVCAAAAFVLLGTCTRPYSEPAFSRLATVYSLTEYGTFYLEGLENDQPNPFLGTVDKVMVRGRNVGGSVEDGYLISSKPPIMPLVMTAEYLLLNRTLGWDLKDEAHVERIVCTMTMTLVGAAYVLGLIFFLKALYVAHIEPVPRLMLLASLAFGTQLWGFGTMLNNHVPAAGLLLVVLYMAGGLASGALAPKGWRFVVFGFASALVATLDMPCGIYPFLVGLFLVWRFPLPTLTWGVLGAAVPLAVHFGVMLWVTGSPLPVQVYKETYLYEGSPWRHPMGIDGL
ncbi:MAG: hypothetical protein GY851_19400, partial [bacterium]|nr:hypothetical protein [bacterium]